MVYLLKHYLLTLVVFLVGKAAFALYCGGMSLWAFGQVVANGLTLDLSTSLYCLIVPMLVVGIAIWVRRWGVLRKVLKGYNALLALALTLAIVADTALYPYWGFKLDASALQYLSEPSGLTQSVTPMQMVAGVAVILIVWALLAALYNRIVPRQPKPRNRLLATLVWLCAVPMVVIGIRGGLGESTTNVGQVYFSQNQFLNHSAVNPLFSFLSSFEKTVSELPDYHFMPDDEARRLAESCFPKENGDSLAPRLLTTATPNVVVILMESAGAEYAPVMPCLERLKGEGISFDSCYANSWRTDRGTVSTLSGFPAFPRTSVMKMPRLSAQLPSLARTLNNNGWHTGYLYGGDINFTNQRSYLVATGWEQTVSMDDFTAAERQSAKWGVRDDIAFGRLKKMMEAAGNPFLIGFTTLSSHEPWDVPEPDEQHLRAVQSASRGLGEEDRKKLRAFAYLDQCVGDFMDYLRRSPMWDSTLVVLLPDHATNFADLTETHPRRNLIPMVWAGGAVARPLRIAAICNQSDLAATLLSQLRLPHDDFTYSRDVASAGYRYPVAFHNYTSGFSVVDSTGFVHYDLDADRLTVATSRQSDRLVKLGKAVLQESCATLRSLGKVKVER